MGGGRAKVSTAKEDELGSPPSTFPFPLGRSQAASDSFLGLEDREDGERGIVLTVEGRERALFLSWIAERRWESKV